LQLGQHASEASLAAALAQALAVGCWSAEGVEQLLRQAQVPVAPQTQVDLLGRPNLAPLAQIEIPLPDLRVFAALVEGASA
jgi:hypothetical protein